MSWLRSDDIEKLAVGDVVGVTGNYYSGPSIKSVERRTKTQVILNGGMRFNLSGRQVGGSTYSSMHLCTAESAREDLRVMKLERWRKDTGSFMRQFNYAQLTDDQITQVLELLKSFTEANAPKSTEAENG